MLLAVAVAGVGLFIVGFGNGDRARLVTGVDEIRADAEMRARMEFMRRRTG